MTSYGIQIDVISLLVGVIVLVAVVVLFGSRRGESGLRFYAFSAVKVVIFFLFWQILWVELRFLTYSGGSIHDIRLQWQLANLAAFIITLSAAIVVEIRFTPSAGEWIHMFDTTPNSRRKILAAGLVVAIVITGAIVALSGLYGFIPKSASRWNPESPYGPNSADYIESRRDDIVLFWMCNCTLVNVNLTEYYRQFSSSAFVDGVEMRFESEAVSVKVMFTPWQDEIVGEGSISVEDWELLSGSLVDDGIGAMEDADTDPDDFYDGMPFDLYLHIYFNDLTFLYIGYGPSNGLVCITNGTWTGQYWPNGSPRITDWDAQGVWLQEDGHLQAPIEDFYDAISQSVVYPQPS